MIEPHATRLETTPPTPIRLPMSEREAQGPGHPRAETKKARPVASAIEGIGCEPAEACLDGEAPLRRASTEA